MTEKLNVNLKPIETVYHGYRFRSRLEARWAVFLETCKLTYDYEPEGYDLDGLWYLPDFWVHPQKQYEADKYATVSGFWLEVKGPEIKPGDEAWQKAQSLAEASGSDVVVFCGQIKPWQRGIRFTGVREEDGTGEGRRVEPYPVQWLQCPICGLIEAQGSVESMECLCVMIHSTRGLTEDAALTARQARFEHRKQDA